MLQLIIASFEQPYMNMKQKRSRMGPFYCIDDFKSLIDLFNDLIDFLIDLSH